MVRDKIRPPSGVDSVGRDYCQLSHSRQAKGREPTLNESNQEPGVPSTPHPRDRGISSLPIARLGVRTRAAALLSSLLRCRPAALVDQDREREHAPNLRSRVAATAHLSVRSSNLANREPPKRLGAQHGSGHRIIPPLSLRDRGHDSQSLAHFLDKLCSVCLPATLAYCRRAS